jgi:hypothetical protein
MAEDKPLDELFQYRWNAPLTLCRLPLRVTSRRPKSESRVTLWFDGPGHVLLLGPPKPGK